MARNTTNKPEQVAQAAQPAAPKADAKLQAVKKALESLKWNVEAKYYDRQQIVKEIDKIIKMLG